MHRHRLASKLLQWHKLDSSASKVPGKCLLDRVGSDFHQPDEPRRRLVGTKGTLRVVLLTAGRHQLLAGTGRLCWTDSVSARPHQMLIYLTYIYIYSWPTRQSFSIPDPHSSKLQTRPDQGPENPDDGCDDVDVMVDMQCASGGGLSAHAAVLSPTKLLLFRPFPVSFRRSSCFNWCFF
jgi:hypothetical protein